MEWLDTIAKNGINHSKKHINSIFATIFATGKTGGGNGINKRVFAYILSDFTNKKSNVEK